MSSALLGLRFVRQDLDGRCIDSVNMAPDRIGRRLRIMGIQSGEDRDMIEIAPLDRGWLRDSNPAVVEHEGVKISDKVGEERVAARAIDGEMKLAVADQ